MSETDDEARQLLQQRMTVLFKLMFWSFTALLLYVWGQYTIYGGPKHRMIVYAGSLVGIGGMGIVWRVMLVGRAQSLRDLHRLDVVYAVATGLSFGASSYLQADLRPAAYMALIYTGATVFARALILPSSTKRTAILSTVMFVPMTVSGAVLALTTTQELSGPAFFFGYLLLSTVPIVLATFGSYVIYDLRKQISDAQQIGEYRLEGKLGEGGMGKVYRARHVLLRRPTAVKVLPVERFSAESLTRFEREVQTLSQLTHPNTVAVFDHGRSVDGVFYYAMEYLGGGIDLDRLVKRHGKQPIERVTRILVQVCGSLQEAHERGIIHRDIKPPNIILCERGGIPDYVKVVDFGLVKEVKDDEESDGNSTARVILGTPHYIAPEAATDPEAVSTAVDIYQLGCVAYFLLTGKRVFEAARTIDALVLHITKAPEPPSSRVPEIPPALDAIVLKCLAKQPADRFESAAALADALRGISATDWSDVQAREWWRVHRRTADVAASTDVTHTIQIDLGKRELA